MSDQVESGSVLNVLLVCFEGAKRAAALRKPLSKQLEQHGSAVLDAVVIQVDGKGKARVVLAPLRIAIGIMTAALTWGVFGVLTGSAGWLSLVIWGLIGAVLGGLFAYNKMSPLSQSQIRRVGEGMRPDSSAIAVFTKGGAGEGVAGAALSSAAAYGPTTASLAAIAADLSARVLAGTADRIAVAAAAGGQPPLAESHTLFNMLLVRRPGQHATRRALDEGTPATPHDPSGPRAEQVEVVLESDPRGRVHVHSPNFGVRAGAKSSLVSWAELGLIFGGLAGFVRGGGILGFLGSGLVAAVVCGAFGILAGALYGLWVGSAVSAGQLKGMEALLPPDSSLAIAWTDGTLTSEALDRWAPPGSQRLVLRFDTAPQGIVLGVEGIHDSVERARSGVTSAGTPRGVDEGGAVR
jgi:uncharacterized membrane protein